MENKRFVEIPQENFVQHEIFIDGIKGVSWVNEGLNNFDNKDVFPWNLIVTLDLEKETDDTKNKIFNDIKDFLAILKKRLNNETTPNTLLIAQVYCNNECDFVWRVHNEEVAKEILDREIEDSSGKFEFSYILSYDFKWLEIEELIKI